MQRYHRSPPPHKDGWRAEHLIAFTAEQDCAAAITDFVGALAAEDVTDATCDLLSSARLVILLKKIKEEMAAMRAAQGEAYLQSQRPLGMGGTLTKLAVTYILGIVEAVVGVAAWPHQFGVNAKGGCDMVQWVLQIIMKALPDLARATLDAINAFGDQERPCTRAALLANVHLHQLILVYDVLYIWGSGELWYYDEFGNFVLALFCKRGVRQGCVLGNTILNITVRLV